MSYSVELVIVLQQGPGKFINDTPYQHRSADYWAGEKCTY